MDKLLKYSLYDSSKISEILDLFTTKIEKRSCIIKGKTGEHDFGSKYMSRKTAEFLTNEGMTVVETVNTQYRGGKKVMFGIEIEITKGKGARSYKDNGVIITAHLKADTSKQLENAADKFENQLTNLLTKHKIPLGRLCLESSLGCLYKFGDSPRTCSTNCQTTPKTETTDEKYNKIKEIQEKHSSRSRSATMSTA